MRVEGEEVIVVTLVMENVIVVTLVMENVK